MFDGANASAFFFRCVFVLKNQANKKILFINSFFAKFHKKKGTEKKKTANFQQRRDENEIALN